MNPAEIKLNREFKVLQSELEDYFFSIGHDKISDVADGIIRKKYLKIHDVINKAKKFYKNISNEDLLNTLEKNTMLNVIENEVINLQKYINNGKDIRQKLMKDAAKDVNEIVVKINELEALVYFNNMQKLANQMNARMKQSMGRITFIVNEICNEVFNPYYKQINSELAELSEILNTKQLELIEILEKYPKESEKSKVIKIFDYKKLNKLIEGNGYKEVRQTGDHKIFSDGKKSIPIPQHNLGFGISAKIQKEM